jgi:hypothetical protein
LQETRQPEKSCAGKSRLGSSPGPTGRCIVQRFRHKGVVSQVQKSLEKSPRDDEPKPPIDHPTRFHCPVLDAAEGLETAPSIAPKPATECDLLHTRRDNQFTRSHICGTCPNGFRPA